jgi:hypothetical protein
MDRSHRPGIARSSLFHEILKIGRSLKSMAIGTGKFETTSFPSFIGNSEEIQFRPSQFYLLGILFLIAIGEQTLPSVFFASTKI